MNADTDLDGDDAWFREHARSEPWEEAQLEAWCGAISAWDRHLEACTTGAAERNGGRELLEAFRWILKHERLSSPRLRQRYPHLAVRDLPRGLASAVNRKMARMATALAALTSLSSSRDLEDVRGALRMEDKGSAPKGSAARHRHRIMVHLAADIFDRMVDRQRKYLDGKRQAAFMWPDVTTVFEMVAKACEAHPAVGKVSADVVRRAWLKAIESPGGEALKRCYETARSQSAEVRRKASQQDPPAG
jgi:hypothetical protein